MVCSIPRRGGGRFFFNLGSSIKKANTHAKIPDPLKIPHLHHFVVKKVVFFLLGLQSFLKLSINSPQVVENKWMKAI